MSNSSNGSQRRVPSFGGAGVRRFVWWLSLRLGAGALLVACGDGGAGDKTRPPDTAPVGLETDDTDTNTDTNSDTDTAGVDTAPPLPSFALVDLRVDDIATNVVACVVRWRTDVPATSEVRVEGHPQPFRVFDPALVTEHQVLVIGLHAETVYELVVVSEDGQGGWGTETAPYTTRSLPPTVPVGVVGARDDSLMEPGWTLVNLSNRAADAPPVAAMYDASGQPVWYFVNGDVKDLRGDVHVSLVEGPHVLMGPSGARVVATEVDLYGNVVWTGPNRQEPEIMHHQLERLPSGNNLALQADLEAGVLMDHVRLYAADHSLQWTWRLRDVLPPPYGANYDYSHCNAAAPGVDPDHLIISCRNLHTVFAVSRATGEILWRLGTGGDFAPDPDANRPFTRWQHAPEQQADGNILVYDNDGVNAHTRVVEYALDHQAMTSTIVWEFPGSFQVDAWYREGFESPIWGDADRLPNGNTLVCFGQRANDRRSRVFEVTSDGQVVWELLFPTEPGYITGLYRADRIVPPLIELL